MTPVEPPSDRILQQNESISADEAETKVPLWRRVLLSGHKSAQQPPSSGSSFDGVDETKTKPEKWSLGVLNDKQTDEVPGTFWAQ